jgi:hypothetical protein
MTGQVPDELIYNESIYSIVGLKGEFLPEPFDFGFKPVSPNTANWRGFIMTYAIAEEHLLLRRMDLWVKEIDGKPPIINEVKPKLEEEGIVRLIYDNLELRTEFTGKILIAKDFINSLYVHMGFQSPLSFETVIELVFQEGKLLSANNFSEKMKKYRKKNISDGKRKPNRDFQAWIARTFSLDYDF